MKNNESAVIIWSDKIPISNLSAYVRHEYNTIMSHKEFIENIDNVGGALCIMILCELDWDEYGRERNMSENYGVEYAKKILRVRHNIKTPIIFISISSVDLANRYDIINCVGHAYCAYKDIANIEGYIKKLHPLNDMQMLDIVANYCDNVGIVGELYHKAKNRVLLLSDNDQITRRQKIADIIAKLKTDISNIAVIENLIDLYFKELELCVSSDDIASSNIVRLLNETEQRIKSCIMSNDYANVIDSQKRLWKILVLDDEPETIKDIIIKLKDVCDVFVCDTVKMAEEFIESDDKNGNKIVLVIADYRLYEDGGRKHQLKQGYDFICETSKRERFTAFVALSGMNRRFLFRTFSRFNLKVEVYSKDDIKKDDRSSQLFVENVIELGDKIHEVLTSVPNATGWISTEKRKFYIAHRNSLEYEGEEKRISAEARRYVLYVKSILEDKDSYRYEALIDQRINGLTTTLKSIDKQMHVFRKILLARRIALWLIFMEGFSTKRVYALLVNGILDASIIDVNKSSVNNLINTNLCITLQFFPGDILIEERAWFFYTMGVNIDDMREVLLQVQVHCQEAVKASPEILGFLFNEMDEYVVGDGNNKQIIMPGLGSVRRMINIIEEKSKDPKIANMVSKMLKKLRRNISNDLVSSIIANDIVIRMDQIIQRMDRRG